MVSWKAGKCNQYFKYKGKFWNLLVTFWKQKDVHIPGISGRKWGPKVSFLLLNEKLRSKS